MFRIPKLIVATALVFSTLAFTAYPLKADEDYKPLPPERLLTALESLLMELETGVDLSEMEDLGAYRDIMMGAARRLEDDQKFRAVLNERLAGVIDEYTASMPEEIGRLPDKSQLPAYDNLDRTLAVLTNVQGPAPGIGDKLKYLKFFLYGASSFNIDDYPRIEDIHRTLKEYEAKYPDRVRVINYGDSTEGRPLLAVEITNRSVPASNKPVIEFDAGIHPSEITSVPVVLSILGNLVEAGPNDEETLRWLNRFRFLFIPLVNPDGYHYVLNGDVHQNNNAYVKDATLAGVNLNRNFPFAWDKTDSQEPDLTNPYYRSYRGPGPGSEPETRALMRLMSEALPLASINYHSEGENILYPSAKNDTNLAADLFINLGESYVREAATDHGVVGGFKVGTAKELYGFSPGGALIDWLWQELSVLAFVCELVDIQGEERPDQEYVNGLVLRQTPGWRGFIRRLEGPAIRGVARFAGTADLAGVVYRIKKPSPQAGDNLAAKTFPLRNSHGLVYSIVQPGEYLILFERNGTTLAETPVKVEDGIVDLGEIILRQP